MFNVPPLYRTIFKGNKVNAKIMTKIDCMLAINPPKKQLFIIRLLVFYTYLQTLIR